jgi:hypothetical protein
MVSFPASMDFGVGLTLTVGSITWTVGVSRAARTVEEVQPALTASPTASPTTPISGPTLGSTSSPTRRQLPRYQGKKIDDFNLIDPIDRQTERLESTLSMVQSIRSDLAQDGFTVVHRRRRSPTSRTADHPRRPDPTLVVAQRRTTDYPRRPDPTLVAAQRRTADHSHPQIQLWLRHRVAPPTTPAAQIQLWLRHSVASPTRSNSSCGTASHRRPLSPPRSNSGRGTASHRRPLSPSRSNSGCGTASHRRPLSPPRSNSGRGFHTSHRRLLSPPRSNSGCGSEASRRRPVRSNPGSGLTTISRQGAVLTTESAHPCAGHTSTVPVRAEERRHDI